MPVTLQVKVKDGDALVLIGTMKGVFLLRSNAARKSWELGGPHFPGTPVYALAFDKRQGKHRVWAGAKSWRWGTVLRSSDDFGKSWTDPATYSIKFPEASGLALNNIWQICPEPADEPDMLYCGVEPSALFVSRDDGKTWSPDEGLLNHPHRPKWTPGFGGMCLHTIVLDPVNRARITVAMSTGGVYRTDDGGKSWQARNKGIRAEFLPDKYPEFGQCVHKVVQHPSKPGRLFAQNHWGLYRSDDGADSWKDIAKGVPSDFGFAMAAHPHDPDTVYTVPMESDEFRCAPEGKLRVYRTRNAGGSWEPLAKGLPQKGALETVLRDALTTDTFDPAGIYFGTRSGKIFGSSDEGKSWELLVEGLPQVVCVKAAVSGEPRPARRAAPKPVAKRPAHKRGRKS